MTSGPGSGTSGRTQSWTPVPSPTPTALDPSAVACASFAAYGRNPSVRRFWSETRRSWIAYRTAGLFVVALGGPAGAAEEWPELKQRFTRWAHPRQVLWYGVGPSRSGLPLGQEAIVRLSSFCLEGPAMANLRHSVARAKRAGLRVEVGPWASLALPTRRELERVEREWSRRHRLRLGFSLSSFQEAKEDERLWVVVGSESRVEAFATWLPSGDGTGWVLDLMRRRRDSVPGAMELALVHSIELARCRCLEWVSLGVAGADMETSGGKFCRRVRAFFCPTSLRSFKEKFKPEWQERFVATPPSRICSRMAPLVVAWVHLTASPARPGAGGAGLRLAGSAVAAAVLTCLLVLGPVQGRSPLAPLAQSAVAWVSPTGTGPRGAVPTAASVHSPDAPPMATTAPAGGGTGTPVAAGRTPTAPPQRASPARRRVVTSPGVPARPPTTPAGCAHETSGIAPSPAACRRVRLGERSG